MTRAIDDLLPILDLEQLEHNLYRGRSPQVGWQRVFGGQVIGQALVAACRTVEDRRPHSLHAYFLLARRPQDPDHLRGRSDPRRTQFHDATRGRDPAWAGDILDVGLLPRGRARLRSCRADARYAEPGGTAGRSRDEGRIMPLMPDPVRAYYERERPIELRPVEFMRYASTGNERDRNSMSGSARPGGCRTIRRSISASLPTPRT